MTREATLSGWFWRFTWPDGRAAIVLCGVCPGWALAGVATWPGDAWRPAILDGPVVDDSGVRIGNAFAGEAERLRVVVPGARVHADLHDVVGWPRPWHGTGPAGWAPFMRQYWRPLVLRARAEGFVELGERLRRRPGDRRVRGRPGDRAASGDGGRRAPAVSPHPPR